MVLHLRKYIFYLIGIVLNAASMSGQQPQVIKLKKEPLPFKFYQKNIESDTIYKSRNDTFFLSVPDSLKEQVILRAENALWAKTEGECLIRLVYMEGLQYEFIYEKEDGWPSGIKGKSEQKPGGEYKILINGATNLEPGRIIIRIIYRFSGETIYEKEYRYIAR